MGEDVGVILLGAGGLVAQRIQERLASHPLFRIEVVAGSPNTAGRRLTDLKWDLDSPRPINLDHIVLSMKELLDSYDPNKTPIAFSTLPADIAAEIEPNLVKRGCRVYSNASTHRMMSNIPLIIPEVNGTVLERRKTENAGIVCSTNCTVMPVAMTLAPIHRAHHIQNVRIKTEQSLSGGGAALLRSGKLGEAFNQKIPGEAEKMEDELRRLLADIDDDGIEEYATFDVDIECSRVGRPFGHEVHIEARTESIIDEEEILRLWATQSSVLHLALPSSPTFPLMVRETIQPERDLRAGEEGIGSAVTFDLKQGMAIVVTPPRIENGWIRWRAFSANTIRGAAGGCVLLAEFDTELRTRS